MQVLRTGEFIGQLQAVFAGLAVFSKSKVALKMHTPAAAAMIENSFKAWLKNQKESAKAKARAGVAASHAQKQDAQQGLDSRVREIRGRVAALSAEVDSAVGEGGTPAVDEAGEGICGGVFQELKGLLSELLGSKMWFAAPDLRAEVIASLEDKLDGETNFA